MGKISKAKKNLHEQNDAIHDFVIRGPISLGDFDASVRGITELSCHLGGVQRTSVWSISEGEDISRCLDIFDSRLGIHSVDAGIPISVYSEYDAPHRRMEIVAVSDVRTDPRTRQLVDFFYTDRGIVALLDVPFKLADRQRGILHLEATDGPRNWGPDDEQLATVLATIITLAWQAAERRTAEETAKKGEEALRAIIDAAPYPIAINRVKDGTYLDANRTILNSFRLQERSQLNGKHPTDFLTVLSEGVQEELDTALAEGRPLDNFQWEYRKKNGERKYTMLSTRPVEYKGERAMVSVSVEITELKHAEEKLKILNERLEQKVSERTEELALTNLDLQSANVGLAKAIVELKETQEKALLSEKMASLGRLIAGIAHELNTPLAALAAVSRLELKNLGDGLDLIAKAASRLTDEEMAFIRRTRERCAKDRSRVFAAEPGAERAARREADAVLRKAGVIDPDIIAEDLVELGIADLAESAAPILSGEKRDDFLYVLRASIGSYRAALIADDAVMKAARVVSALRTYAHGGNDESISDIALAPEIRGLLELYYNHTKRGIEITIDIPENLKISGKREALNRVWFNLLSNAIHAVGEKGRIEIIAAEDEGVVRVSFADSGSGIPADIQGRIFEPFFTTKSAGEGTGLGLDIARRLARENGGNITFTSRPGRTVFTVTLPRGSDTGTGGNA